MKHPPTESLRLAADWLRVYEDDEAQELAAVAAWLDQQADAADMRSACREAGVPVSIARAALRQKAGA